MVDNADNSNPLVVNAEDIPASPETVFELLRTEEGRELWLEPDPERVVRVEAEEPPDGSGSGRVAWWWWSRDEAPRHVELWVVAIPTGTRVIAIESAPAMPLTMLARAAATAGMGRALEARRMCAAGA